MYYETLKSGVAMRVKGVLKEVIRLKQDDRERQQQKMLKGEKFAFNIPHY
jgi:hypothetical protein